MTEETRKVLTAARRLIAEPECWTQGYYARDKDKKPVYSDNPDAVCWCLEGAIFKSLQGRIVAEGVAYRDILTVLQPFFPKGSVELTVFNDTHTHAEVLALLDKVLEEA